MNTSDFDDENTSSQDDDLHKSDEENQYDSEYSSSNDGTNIESSNLLNFDDQEDPEDYDDELQVDGDEFDLAENNVAVKINIKGAQRSNIKGVEINNNYYSYVTENFKWLETNSERIEKNKQVFVNGSAVKNNIITDNQRVIVINGEIHTGRYSLALNIADSLAKSPETKIFTLQCFVKTSLFAIFLDKNLPSDSVFIIRNAFNDPGIMARELQDSFSDIKGLLKQNNSYLILTNDQEDLEFQKDIYQIPDTGIKHSDLIKIFNTHLSFLENGLDKKIVSFLRKNKKTIQELTDILKRPYYIDDFFKSLVDFQFDEKYGAATLLDQAKNVNKSDVQLNIWFEELTDIEKYFAFTISLFPDMRRVDLIKRFTRDTNKLRQTKSNLAQVADLGFQDYLRKTSSRLTDWDTVEFEDIKVRTFVLTQLRNNFFFHYWNLREEYAEAIKANADKQGIEARISYSRALGELGKSDFDGLENILHSLGVSEFTSIRASIGYCLKQVCTDVSYKGNVEKLLQTWSQDTSQNLRWTAIAVGEKLYWEFQDTVINIINRLVSDWRNISAVTHALVKLSRVDPQRVSSILLEWMDESEIHHNAIQKRIAIKTSYKIFSDLRIGNSRRRNAILPLVKRVLFMSENHCQKTLAQIRIWILNNHKENWADLGDTIAESMVSDNKFISDAIVNKIKNDWLHDENTTLRMFSKELLHYHNETLIDAETLESELIPTGLLFVDITSDSAQPIKFAKELIKKANWANFTVRPMGVTDLTDTDLSLWIARGIKPVRLIGPLLEKMGYDNYSFILIITLDDVIDIDDWADSPWNNKKMVVHHFDKDISRVPGIMYLKNLTVERLDMLLQLQFNQ